MGNFGDMLKNTAGSALNSLGGGVVGMGMNLLGGLFQPSKQKLADEQYKQQEKLSNLQQKMQWDTIDKVNEYNTPANAVARLKEAGLNPGLAYSSGAGGSGGTTAVPSVRDRKSVV